jgi:hypothetical protein
LKRVCSYQSFPNQGIQLLGIKYETRLSLISNAGYIEVF